MSTRTVIAVVVSVLTVGMLVFGCSSRDEYVEARIAEARELAARREYERAQDVLDRATARMPDEFDLLMERADIYTRAHAYQDAREWFGRASQVDPRSWKAVVGGWEAELEQWTGNEETKERIRGEADAILAAGPETLWRLSAAVAAYQLTGADRPEEEETELGAAFAELRDRLVDLYPMSELASDLIKEECDWVAVERDDETRLEMADEFLATYPVTEWRTKVMGYKMGTLNRLGQFD